VSKTFERLVRDAGLLKLNVHSHRHTCATVGARNGTPPHVMAAQLGMDVKVYLSTYAHVLAEQEEEVADKLADAFLTDSSH
jgi:integrase